MVDDIAELACYLKKTANQQANVPYSPRVFNITSDEGLRKYLGISATGSSSGAGGAAVPRISTGSHGASGANLDEGVVVGEGSSGNRGSSYDDDMPWDLIFTMYMMMNPTLMQQFQSMFGQLPQNMFGMMNQFWSR